MAFEQPVVDGVAALPDVLGTAGRGELVGEIGFDVPVFEPVVEEPEYACFFAGRFFVEVDGFTAFGVSAVELFADVFKEGAVAHPFCGATDDGEAAVVRIEAQGGVVVEIDDEAAEVVAGEGWLEFPFVEDTAFGDERLHGGHGFIGVASEVRIVGHRKQSGAEVFVPLTGQATGGDLDE